MRASWLAVLAAPCANGQLRITGHYCASLSPAMLAGLVLSAGQMDTVRYRPWLASACVGTGSADRALRQWAAKNHGPLLRKPLAGHTCWLGALGRADGNDLIWIWLLLRRSTVLAEAIGDSRQWAAKNHAPLLRKPLATIRYGSRAEKQQRRGSSDIGHGPAGAGIAACSDGRALCQWAARNHEPLSRAIAAQPSLLLLAS